MDSLSPKIILLVKNRAFGDSIMGLSSISYLREQYPMAKIIYGVPEWVAPLYKNVVTDADEILPLNFSSMMNWWKMWWKIKKLNPDIIHEMHLSGRGQKFFELFGSFNSIPYSSHNHHLNADNQQTKKVHDQGIIKPLIQRDLDGVWSCLAENKKMPSYLDYPPVLKFAHEQSPHVKNQIIFGVVATRKTKMWPLKSYVELARIINEKTHYQIIIPLSKNSLDKEIEKELQQLGLPENCHIIKSPLTELPKLIQGSHCYIGNDTGLKHLSISLGVKTYTFFGPEPTTEWHPYNKELHPFFYKEGLECRTKEAHYCGLNFCESMICLNEFLPKDIFNQIDF